MLAGKGGLTVRYDIEPGKTFSIVPATLEPVTTGGWYERTDGTVGEYRWQAGRVVIVREVQGWADVPRED